MILVLGLTLWAFEARILRGQALSLKNRDFVHAAKVAGESTLAHRLRRADAEHDQPHRRGVRARLLHRAARRRRPRVPRPRRHLARRAGAWRSTGRRRTRPSCRASGGRSSSPALALVLTVLGARLRCSPASTRSATRACAASRDGGRQLPATPSQARALAGGGRMTAWRSPDRRSRERETLVEVRELAVEYGGERPCAPSTASTSRSRAGEILGLAGESGCGKSTVANAVMQILRPPGADRRRQHPLPRRGPDAARAREELRRFRWRNVSMVFQSAMNALNPVMRVGDQFVDMMRAHERISKQRRARARRRAARPRRHRHARASARTRTSSPAACASA